METQRPPGIMAVMQQHLDALFSSMNISARDVITYVSCFGFGFLAGVMLKRYGKWIISMLLVAVLAITVLHYLELITVHKANIKEVLGLQQIHTLDELVQLVQVKLQDFWIEVSLSIVAIVIGFKLG